MTFLLIRPFQNRPHYWNTCGWSIRDRTARKYNRQEAEAALKRMEADGQYGVFIGPYFR